MVVLQTDGERAAFIAGMEFAWGHMADGGHLPDQPTEIGRVRMGGQTVVLPGPTLADALEYLREMMA